MAKPSAPAVARKSAEPCQGRGSIDGSPAHRAQSPPSGKENRSSDRRDGRIDSQSRREAEAGARFRLAGERPKWSA